MKKLYGSIIFLFIIGLGIFIFIKIKAIHNTPISEETFISEMRTRGYQIVEQKREDIPIAYGPFEVRYIATKKTNLGNEITAFFYIFKNQEEAREVFLNTYARIKTEQTESFELLNKSGWFGNTQYYIELYMPPSGVITQMWSVENTFIIVQSDEFPMVTEGIFEVFGYRY